MHKRLFIAYSGGVLILGMAIGILLQRAFPVGDLLQSIRGGAPTPTRISGFPIYPAPTPLPGSAISVTLPAKTMVLLTLGQSNAGNWGETRYASRNSVYNFFEGRFYRAQDPLFGADGVGGSTWTRVADQVIDAHLYDAVVIVPLAVGSSAISRWIPGGDIHPRLLTALRDLKAHDLIPTQVLWVQGESDAEQRTRGRDYKNAFLAIVQSLRSHDIVAPIYIATATQCAVEPDEEIRGAQQSLASMYDHNLFPGPDLDRLGSESRRDGCHLSARGLQEAARLWLTSLTTPLP